MNRGVIEPARRDVGGKVDVAVQAEGHAYPAAFRWQNAYSASYIGNSHSSFWWSSAVRIANPRAIASSTAASIRSVAM